MRIFTQKNIGIFYSNNEQKEKILEYFQKNEIKTKENWRYIDRDTGGYHFSLSNIDIRILPISECVRGMRFNEIYIFKEDFNNLLVDLVVLPTDQCNNVKVITYLGDFYIDAEDYNYYKLKKKKIGDLIV